MKRIHSLIIIFIVTVLCDILFAFALDYYGPGRFFNSWWAHNSNWIITILVGAIIIFILWLYKISTNKETIELKKLEKENYHKETQPSKFNISMCPKCGATTYYFYDKDPCAPCILECWSCKNQFSFAWCENCDMGSDFIKDIKQRPNSWQCPDCETIYPLPTHIFDYPTTTFDFSELPQPTKVQHLQAQHRYQIKTAAGTIFVIAAVGFAILLWRPIIEILQFFTHKPEINSIVQNIPEIIFALLALPGIFIFLLAIMGNLLLPMQLIQHLFQAWKQKEKGN